MHPKEYLGSNSLWFLSWKSHKALMNQGIGHGLSLGSQVDALKYPNWGCPILAPLVAHLTWIYFCQAKVQGPLTCNIHKYTFFLNRSVTYFYVFSGQLSFFVATGTPVLDLL